MPWKQKVEQRELGLLNQLGSPVPEAQVGCGNLEKKSAVGKVWILQNVRLVLLRRNANYRINSDAAEGA